MFHLDEFISKYVIKRPQSMFAYDIQKNDKAISEKIEGKTVLVIGGAGSIGSSFIKAVLPFRPKALTVIDINENGLAELTRDLRSTYGMYIPRDYVCCPADYSSAAFAKLFEERRGFDIAVNFSAHKHVRSEKDIYSVEMLLRNNVLNAKKLLDILSEYPPEEYFCVSTDKAANPVNIMGASKRLMEDVIFSYSDKFPVKTARFANVAFSNGSLPAGFLSRIAKLQPISAPLDVERYFVSPQESGQICMLACLLAENREIFFPKLEESQMMSFDKIASLLLHEYGYEEVRCSSADEALKEAEKLKEGSRRYPVYYTVSDTTGEKKTEEFYTASETVEMDRFRSLGVIAGKKIPDQSKVGRLLENLDKAFEARASKEDLVKIIQQYLPEFKHIEKGKSLDSKM